jgi:phosphatidylserine decarboxylase
MSPSHHYIDRDTGRVCAERLFHDRLIRFVYSSLREHVPSLYQAATSRWTTWLLGLANYDLALGSLVSGNRRFLRELNVDLSECLDPPESLCTARQVFERRIRFWDCRPMPHDPRIVVSPADSRVVVGSLHDSSPLYVKGKFFSHAELLGKLEWIDAFHDGDFAIFRLTPDKYHFNHLPVTGIVVDHFEIDGQHHACNPTAVVELLTPFSKNRRVVTVIDTDVPHGSGVGLVAMIEVVAMMIGGIVQCYSAERYDAPRLIEPGVFVCRGQPKSLYRPGSSTDVLLFQSGRVEFAPDLVRNLFAPVATRFSTGFGQPLVETDVKVRSWLAHPRGSATHFARLDGGMTNDEIRMTKE